MTSPLVASHLSKTYKGRAAVDDVSFAGRSGRVLGLLGKNGAGKTTTIKMLLDLVRPERGTAEINGRPYSTTVDAARHVGVALDDMSFLPGAKVRFELGVWATTIGVPPVRVDEVIENVGLSEHVGSKVKSLSTRTLVCRDAQSRLRELIKPRRTGKTEYRDQPRDRHEIRIIEHSRHGNGSMLELRLRDASQTREIGS